MDAARLPVGLYRILIASLTLSCAQAFASHEKSQYDKETKAAIIAGVTAVDTFFLLGLAPPPYSQVFELGEWGEDLVLKHLPAVLTAPVAQRPMTPNTADQCDFKFVLPQSQVEFTNFFGVVNFRPPLGGWYNKENPDEVVLAEVNEIESCIQGYRDDYQAEGIDEPSTRFLRRKCDFLKNNWGVLGAPDHLWHANTDVIVSVSGSSAGIIASEFPQVVTMPSGTHQLSWQADTQRDLVMDIIVPPILITAGVLTELFFARYGDDIIKRLDRGISEVADGAADAVKYAKFKKWVREKAIEWVIKEGPKQAGEKITKLLVDGNTSVTTASSLAFQFVSVYDVHPPTIAVHKGFELVRLEASDFGGTATRHHRNKLLQSIDASDECGREVILSNNTPEFLRMGETTITWTAEDLGPNPADGKDYAPTTTQLIIVEDTQKPLMIAPAALVLETDKATLDVSEIALGSPLIADLADPEPVIEHDAPISFPVNSRTEVEWRATDASKNQTITKQWVTIKATGTNTAPEVKDGSFKTQTSKELKIVLTATDDDFIDGMFDPVWFSIVENPENGQFVAPLLPFFIDDYRTRPSDELGPGFAQAVATNQANAWIENNVCNLGQQPPFDFVFEPLFAHVMDDGTRYILDTYFTCDDDGNDKAYDHQRISKWDKNDLYIAQFDFGASPEELPNNSAFLIADDGYLYYSTFFNTGSSSEFNLHQCSTDFVQDGSLCPVGFNFRSDSAAPDYSIDVASMTTAAFDSESGVLYLTDKSRVYVFERLSTGGTRFLDILSPPGANDGRFIENDKSICSSFLNGRNIGYGMEIDDQGSFYIADSCSHRIHKFSPSYFDGQGSYINGEYVGWLGKCTKSTNNACNKSKKRSYGFTCTDDTCSISQQDTNFGEQTGQFNLPLYLAIDPNDILYVADYENFRVQRFAADGTFSGEAASTGTGINSGEEPSFVLGNMSRPRALSVNSSQFFVVDRDTSFMHIFGTLPFEDITEDSATVTYVSKLHFHNKTDQFSFRVSDGLADSNIATISITVNRNFRPPHASASTWLGNEDKPVTLKLAGTDPDGVVDQDDNGLDTLIFEITTPPEHGKIVSAGAPESGEWTYIPDQDFYGMDSFAFTSNDGKFTSDPAIVTLEVLPVNDPPVLQLEPSPRVGRGFPASFKSTFTDDPSDQYSGIQTWGDGSVDIQGELLTDPDTGESGFEAGKALYIAPPGDMQDGSTVVSHVYASLGSKRTTLCLTDSGNKVDCKAWQVEVEDLVAIGLTGQPNPIETDAGMTTTFEIEIVNQVPDFGPGLVAENVKLEAVLGGVMEIQNVSPSSGHCSYEQDNVITCDFSDMPNGEAINVVVNALGQANIIYDEIATLDVEVQTTSEAVSDSIFTLLRADIIADASDSDNDGMPDNFEKLYGLDPSTDDADLDRDGDGLSNLEEFENMTSPIEKDTDGDGISDFDEIFVHGTDPVNDDTDGDGLPDGWEIDHGLDPLRNDANEDADGDGISNLGEYLKTTNVPVFTPHGIVTLVLMMFLFAYRYKRRIYAKPQAS